MEDEELKVLMGLGILAPIDVHFADLMAGLSGGGGRELRLAASLVSSATREGHICLDLSRMAGACLGGEEGGSGVTIPEFREWRDRLLKQPAVALPGEYAPLVLDETGRLYLYRYWDYQERLARGIKMLAQDDPATDLEGLRQDLDRLFPGGGRDYVDWQKIAAFTALDKGLCVISGGPGTGKTTTILKILALLLERAGLLGIRIALAAPTGKAATRLEEAIREGRRGLNCCESVKEAIPQKASTLHRLLGSIKGSPYFRHNADHPLAADVVVVDEVSMVDLALMSKLVQALRPGVKLILLGDKDQLASVEAGAVLGDLCDRGRTHGFSAAFAKRVEQGTGYRIVGEGEGRSRPGIRDAVVELRTSYRFGSLSGIYALSRAVNEGKVDETVAILRGGGFPDIGWKDDTGHENWIGALEDAVRKGLGNSFAVREPLDVLRSFERFRILCALREGPYGANAVNRAIERMLRVEGLIRPDREGVYAGRPILITRNDYGLGLFNGDMGIIMPDPDSAGGLRAFFQGPEDRLRRFHPLMLPDHETVFAMTVHKSQGSEFDRVILVLPDRDSPLLTRELIYTGITRARKHIGLWGPEKVIRKAVSRCIERVSGLREALWGPLPPGRETE